MWQVWQNVCNLTAIVRVLLQVCLGAGCFGWRIGSGALAARRDVWGKGQPCTYCRETCNRLQAVAVDCKELQGSAMNLWRDAVSCREVQGCTQWTLQKENGLSCCRGGGTLLSDMINVCYDSSTWYRRAVAYSLLLKKKYIKY